MFRCLAAAAVLTMILPPPAMAQKASDKAPVNASTAAKRNPMASTAAYLNALRRNTTTAGKVALAEAAGPAKIARHATIVAMNSEMESKVLRAGTNGWTCIADPKGPMCLDESFNSWAGALMSKLPPNTTKVGIGYMLVGDDGVSLTDPFAKTPTKDWVKSGAHTMLIVPDASQLNGFPDNPSTGGPYVMWKGTPYAHVMVPAK